MRKEGKRKKGGGKANSTAHPGVASAGENLRRGNLTQKKGGGENEKKDFVLRGNADQPQEGSRGGELDPRKKREFTVKKESGKEETRKAERSRSWDVLFGLK